MPPGDRQGWGLLDFGGAGLVQLLLGEGVFLWGQWPLLAKNWACAGQHLATEEAWGGRPLP